MYKKIITIVQIYNEDWPRYTYLNQTAVYISSKFLKSYNFSIDALDLLEEIKDLKCTFDIRYANIPDLNWWIESEYNWPENLKEITFSNRPFVKD